MTHHLSHFQVKHPSPSPRCDANDDWIRYAFLRADEKGCDVGQDEHEELMENLLGWGVSLLRSGSWVMGGRLLRLNVLPVCVCA